MKRLFNFVADWQEDRKELVFNGEIIREGKECNTDALFDYLKNNDRALKILCDSVLDAYECIDELQIFCVNKLL